MLNRTFRSVLAAGGGRARTAEDNPKLEACAFLGPRAGADVYARALRDVILPGFETLGIDLGPSRALLRERRWV